MVGRSGLADRSGIDQVILISVQLSDRRSTILRISLPSKLMDAQDVRVPYGTDPRARGVAPTASKVCRRFSSVSRRRPFAADLGMPGAMHRQDGAADFRPQRHAAQHARLRQRRADRCVHSIALAAMRLKPAKSIWPVTARSWLPAIQIGSSRCGQGQAGGWIGMVADDVAQAYDPVDPFRGDAAGNSLRPSRLAWMSAMIAYRTGLSVAAQSCAPGCVENRHDRSTSPGKGVYSAAG